MKKTSKILALLLAFVMVFGAVAPTMAAGEAQGTTKVTLHKLLMTKDELTKWDHEGLLKGTETVKGYDGSQDLAGLNAILEAQRKTKVNEIPDVYFAWQFKDSDGNWKYIKGNEEEPTLTEEGKLQVATTVDEAFGKETSNIGAEFNTDKLPAGSYKLVEIRDKSTYKNENGSILADQKAVPVEITLPIYKTTGEVVTEAHVYPKNTEEKPQIDKNFAKQKESENPEFYNNLSIEQKDALGADYNNYQNNKAQVSATIGTKVPYEVKTLIKAGSRYKNLTWSDTMTNGLTFNKDSLVLKPGTFVLNEDYVVTADSRGFNLEFTQVGLKKLEEQAKEKDVEITLTYTATVNKDAVVDQPDGNDIKLDYGNNPKTDKISKPVTPKDNKITVTKTWADGNPPEGVVVEFILLKDGQVVDSIVLKGTPWTHTFIGLDDKATYTVRENISGYTPEFTEGEGSLAVKNNKPPKTTPKDKQIKVTKSWDVKPEEMVKLKVVYTLYKADTNTEVKSVLVDGFTSEGEYNGDYSYTFNGLEDSVNYYVVERVVGYNPTYSLGSENGEILISNKKDSNNPSPLNPTEPKVVTGGKKFVKADLNTGARLSGAQFVVRNKDGKYLAIKTEEQTFAEVTAYEKAEALYNKAIADYNKAIAVKETTEDTVKITVEGKNNGEAIVSKTEIQKVISELKADRDAKFLAARERYDWIQLDSAPTEKDTKNVLVLTSNDKGQSEITGLAYGTYKLVEIKSPEGYALDTAEKEFQVGKDSYTKHVDGVKYEDTDKVVDKIGEEAQRVNNKKVTIPQTGGIGTVIFTVAGIAIMATAAYVLVKNNKKEEETA